MEYRKLPHGNEMISTIGLGLGNIHNTATDAEIEEAVNYAFDHGINFVDLCSGRVGVYEAVGRAMAGRREKVYTQMHFGAIYDNDAYGFSRDLDKIKYYFHHLLKVMNTDYADFGYIHCIDEEDDFKKVMNEGLWDYVCFMKEQGVIHHIGFSTHTPSIARKFMETGMCDMFMFSINPAYDYTKGTYAYGSLDDRAALYQEAERLGIGISVMKPFAAGQLLDIKQSPIGVELNKNQCIQYTLDRPAVITCLPGVGSLQNVKEVLEFYNASEEEKDYSVLGSAAPSEAWGRCVYCNHCAPCPKGIDIGLVNKYYDITRIGDEMARSHYEKLTVHADACVQCGHCEKRCPFGVKQMSRMLEIKDYFGK